MAQPNLNELLKQTSRSFYLTLRVLPRAIRPQIGLAYLLARTTDTIADTDLVHAARRLDALLRLRERIRGTTDSTLNFGELAQHQGSAAERELLAHVEASLAALGELSPRDRELVRKVLDTITSGQELDLRRFELARADAPQPAATTEGGMPPATDRAPRPLNLIALQNDTELDDYTYRVAGCVGEFWTEVCVEHLYRLPELDALATPHFEALGVRFGKGLQLVNILRDVPADLRKGRCYLPADQLSEAGLTPADLMSPTNESRLRPLYDRYLDLAESHLAAGWQYTNLIPFTRMRLRLACAWPILIGMETLRRLRVEQVLDARQPVKVSRAEVRSVMVQSLLAYPFSSRWNALFRPGKPVASGRDMS